MSLPLLRIELRRNTTLALLPVLAALAALSPAWRHLSALALWPGRSIDAQTALQGAGPLFAGGAAWVAGRERRRGMDDLLATTPRSTWTRLLATWTATALWGVLLYLIIVAVILGVTARQATWGTPVAWPLLAGLAEMGALAALGCALGHGLPSRFTAPLVGVCAFVAIGLGVTLVNHGDKIGYLAPGYPSISDSVWYASSADLGLIQTLFLLGVASLSLGSLGLSGHGLARTVAITITVAGLALSGTGVALILSSHSSDGMVRVPLFGGAASAAPLSYTPACHHAALPVCVHPAYRAQLAETTTLINRLAAPVLGAPGAPTRAEQRPATAGIIANGGQRILAFTPIDLHDPTNPPRLVQRWIGQLAVSLVAATVQPASRLWTANKAQNALALYLLCRAGVTFDATQFDQGQDVAAAEHRFAALPARVQLSWLHSHYAPLRQGHLRLEDVP